MAHTKTDTRRKSQKARRDQAPQCNHVDVATGEQCGHTTWEQDGICPRHNHISAATGTLAAVLDIAALEIPPDATIVPDSQPKRSRKTGAQLEGSLVKSSRKATEHQESLEKAIRNLHDGEEQQHWKDYLKFSVWVRNHSATRYGAGNRMLIFMALSGKPDASYFILPRKAWEKKGRTVDRDEGIPIWVPVRQKYIPQDADGNEQIDPQTGDPVQRSSLRFYLGGFKGNAQVWDMADTTGEPLEMPHNPMNNRATGSEESVIALSDALHSITEDLDVDIEYKQLPGTTSGYFSRSNKKIVVDTNQDAATQVSTLAHEVAHAVDPFLEKSPWKYTSCRDECEYVAESVAYMLCHTFSIDTEKAAARYLKNWAPERVRQAKDIGDRVDKIYNNILDRVDKNIPELKSLYAGDNTTSNESATLTQEAA